MPTPSGPKLDLDFPPAEFNFATDVIDKWAENAELLALIWTNAMNPKGSRKDLTFRYLSDRSHRAAKWLSEQLGISKEDRILMTMHRVPEWYELLLGAIRLGAVVIPCTTLLTPKDIEYRLRVSNAKVFISDENGAVKLGKVTHVGSLKIRILVSDRAVAQLNGWHSYNSGVTSTTQVGDRFLVTKTKASDPCIIYFTSGTTGPPKMVLHNHISYPLGHAITGQHWYRLSPGKVFWTTAELGWAAAAWAVFGCWLMGAALFVQDDRGAFSPKRIIATLHNFEITTACFPPTAFRQLILQKQLNLIKKFKPKALECCLSAGEALNPHTLQVWKRTTGLEIYEGYGQSETVFICGYTAGTPIRLGSVGKAAPRIPLSLIDDVGNELPPGIEGNIAIRTSPRIPWMFEGYIHENGRVVLPEVVSSSGQHWYMTGDRATRDADGYFWFMGRADDVINTAGYRVGPFEIESLLKEHEGIVESAVVASPDPIRGEIVKAFIVLTDQYQGKEHDQLTMEIVEYVANNTAPYKKPREIEFVDALPKTISGKIRRVELKNNERRKKAHILAKL